MLCLLTWSTFVPQNRYLIGVWRCFSVALIALIETRQAGSFKATVPCNHSISISLSYMFHFSPIYLYSSLFIIHFSSSLINFLLSSTSFLPCSFLMLNRCFSFSFRFKQLIYDACLDNISPKLNGRVLWLLSLGDSGVLQNNLLPSFIRFYGD